MSFELVSGDIGLDGPEELYLSRLTLRLEAEVKSRIEVAVSYDSGAWETLAQLTATGGAASMFRLCRGGAGACSSG